ncbi:hypothetical protein BP5796_04880 [Coleophoma crateriformis]|uniref:Uncharacterized protein n=1 Tax=Coleophoma crateriformis TaxID=565419 RepID=A0A3D8SAJ3_9HELO|nr:hypothetical protein BP5796_04880 [Coleophoma crateriformis]
MPTTRSSKIAAPFSASTRISKLPEPLRFPLLVTLSLTLSSLLYSFSAQFLNTEGDLAAVSRRLDQWWEVGALLGWRACELSLAWWGGYDGYDLAALSALSHGPPLYLLGTFYGVSNTTILSSLLIDAITAALPLHLLRPLSPAHASTSPLPAEEKDIISSISIQILTTLLGAVIYSTTLYGAYASFLPTSLVTYFEGIPTIVPAHTAKPETLFPTMLVMGVAARTFIFTPAAATLPSLADAKARAFNPATATLWETIVYNVWGFRARTKTIIKRTAALILASGIHTFVQTAVTLKGVEPIGALAYSSVWAAAALFTGVAFGFVGDV